jgi:hypothetical protein
MPTPRAVTARANQPDPNSSTACYGRGIPDHLKADAKRTVEELLAEGCLAEKVSQGRRHVWLTAEGQERLRCAEAATPCTNSESTTGRVAA